MTSTGITLSTENHRFSLAMLFVGGFLFIIALALLGEFFGLYSGIVELAAIFSGWMASVIGFYFFQQNAEQAHKQVEKATENAAEARKESEKSLTKTAKLANLTQTEIIELSKLQDDSEAKIVKQKEIIKEQNQLINELLSKLKDLTK